MPANKVNVDRYIQFVEKGDSELYALKVVHGPYTGVIYTYGKVEIKGTVDEPVVKFDFTINEVPKGKKKTKLEKSKTFKNFMGDILITLIEEKVNDESTEADTQESDE
mgnify:FL=1|jgi:hypothetical protein